MNIQEYILSGIVESYVLGLSSEEERIEFERMCAAHPEVLTARNAFEILLENQMRQNAIVAPQELKEKIMATIQSANPMSSGTAKVVTMDSDERISRSKSNWIKYAAAACFILLACSVYWGISLFNENKQLVSNNTLLKNDLDSSNTRLARLEKDVEVLQQNPNVKMTALRGTAVSPTSYATVYWDTTSQDVYLMANNLPRPASDKQYQLWAIFDGKPVDLGLLDYDAKQRVLLVRMKNTRGAQAFAITLEKKVEARVLPWMQCM